MIFFIYSVIHRQFWCEGVEEARVADLTILDVCPREGIALCFYYVPLMVFWHKCNRKWHIKSSSNGVASSTFTHRLWCSWLVLILLDSILALPSHYHLHSTTELINMLIYTEWSFIRCTYLVYALIGFLSGKIHMGGTLCLSERNLISFPICVFLQIFSILCYSVCRFYKPLTVDMTEHWLKYSIQWHFGVIGELNNIDQLYKYTVRKVLSVH